MFGTRGVRRSHLLVPECQPQREKARGVGFWPACDRATTAFGHRKETAAASSVQPARLQGVDCLYRLVLTSGASPSSQSGGPVNERSPLEIRGEYRFRASRRATWEALVDPASLETALPDCERFEEKGPGEYAIRIRAGIGAIKGTYTGVVTVSDQQPHDSYQLTIVGSGKPGRVKGSAEISLREDDHGTVVEYVADVAVQGALARLGSRLVVGAAKLLAGQFFRAMEKEVAQRVP